MRNRKHDIEKYLRGELSPEEMYALEKDALSDPFLAEALEGVEHAGAENFLYDLHKINRSVHDRMRRSTHKNKDAIRMWGWLSGVAATILLIAIAGFYVVKLIGDQQTRNLSMSPETTPQEKSTTSDSLSVGEEPPVRQEAPPVEKDEPEAAPPRQPISARPAPPTADAGEAIAREEEIPLEEEPVVTETIAEQVPPAEDESEAAKKTIAAADTQKERAVTGDRLASTGAQHRSADVGGKQAPAAVTQPAIAVRMITGKVTDENGQDLPGVTVNVQGSSTSTVTDGEGNYRLTVPAQDAKLAFNYIGFDSKEVPLPSGTELNVTLEENIATLSEVVVTGYSNGRETKDSAFRSAEPTVGTNDFKTYLASSVKYPQQAVQNKTEGKVTIRFTVEPTGQLSDFEVIKGIGSGCEEELIRAIRQGPYWKPGKVGDQPVRDKVRVRYKFQLPR